MLKITLATSNLHKVEEINLIAKDFDIEFIMPKGEFNPIEDGDNFLKNAFCKAKAASVLGGSELFLADDSGLCVEALNGAPGIYSARYESTPKKRIEKLLSNMKNKQNRNAKFVCAMVLTDKNANIVFQTQQECLGSILEEERGNGGFGYDPVFFVNEKQKGMAELTKAEKATVSHRAKSLNVVLNWLKNEYKK